MELGRMEEQYYHDQLVLGHDRDSTVPQVLSVQASQIYNNAGDQQQPASQQQAQANNNNVDESSMAG